MVTETEVLANPLQNFLYMYLVHRDDYPSAIAREFEDAASKGNWDADEWGCGGARTISNVTSALKKMEKRGVLTSYFIQDSKESIPGRPRKKNVKTSNSIKKYYSISQDFFTSQLREEIKEKSINDLKKSFALLKSCSSSEGVVIAYLKTCNTKNEPFGIRYLIDCLKKIHSYNEKSHGVSDLDKIIETQDVRVDLSSIFSFRVPLNMNSSQTREYVSKNYDQLLESLRDEKKEFAIDDMMNQVEIIKKMLTRKDPLYEKFEREYLDTNSFQIAYSPPLKLKEISKNCEELLIKSEEVPSLLINSIELLEECYLSYLQKLPISEYVLIGLDENKRYFSVPLPTKMKE